MKLNIKAILIGWVVDFSGSFVMSGLIGIVIVASLVSNGVSPEQIAQHMTDSPLMALGLLSGLVMSTLGGWVAAGIARRDEVPHGAATGLLSVAMYWLVIRSLSGAASSAWYDLVATVLAIPCATLGGYLRGRKHMRDLGTARNIAAPPIPEP
jgi:hypothetical protein